MEHLGGKFDFFHKNCISYSGLDFLSSIGLQKTSYLRITVRCLHKAQYCFERKNINHNRGQKHTPSTWRKQFFAFLSCFSLSLVPFLSLSPSRLVGNGQNASISGIKHSCRLKNGIMSKSRLIRFSSDGLANSLWNLLFLRLNDYLLRVTRLAFHEQNLIRHEKQK